MQLVVRLAGDRGRWRARLTCVLAIFLAVMGTSQTLWAAGLEGKLRLEVKSFRLDNGLEVLVIEDRSTPIVTVQVWYKAGSRNERPGITGISHFLEHMMFKGTATTKANEFSRLVQRLGGRDNAFTSNDMTVYFSTIPSAKLEEAMRYEADRMVNLTLPGAEIAPERKVVMEERRLSENSPTRQLFEELDAVAYKVHPYRWPVVGWMQDLGNITRQALLRYYRTYYRPNNARLIVVGDVRLAAVRHLVEKHFGTIPRHAEAPPVTQREPEQRGERRLRVRLQAKLPVLAVSYHIPAANHADERPLSILTSVLGSGRTSRLYRALVYKEQVATEVGAFADAKLDNGLLTLYATLQDGHTASEAERLIDAQIARVQNEVVSDRELQTAKNNILSEFVFRQQRVGSQAMTIGFFVFYRPLARLNRHLDDVQRVRAEDLQRVARRYLQRQRRTVAELVPIPATDGAARGHGGRQHSQRGANGVIP